jgi:hypothetical protein
MHYWVYGLDGVSKQPCKPLFLEANSEEQARALAAETGMQVEEVRNRQAPERARRGERVGPEGGPGGSATSRPEFHPCR